MTVKELFQEKYLHRMQTINRRDWEAAEINAKCRNMHVADYIMLTLEVNMNELKKIDGGVAGTLYWDLLKLNDEKLIASNRHHQEHGHIDTFWLTRKGLKQLGLASA